MLHSFSFDAAASQPHRPALWVNDRLYSYSEIETSARRVSAGLAAVARTFEGDRCLRFGHHSVAAYVGVQRILDAGMAYMLLSPKVPAARIATIIKQSSTPLMLVDRHCAEMLDEVLVLLDEDIGDPHLPSVTTDLPSLPNAPYVRRERCMDEVAYVAVGLVGFVINARVEIALVLKACRQRLPAYAVPQRIVVVDVLPVNVNGKIDRTALAGQCASGLAVT
jgi:D-alanine--poly(phosphoribitol) ligase subunit 1